MKELEHALSLMKNGKARDTSGLIAEMLKTKCEQLQTMILDLFNDILVKGRPPPENWRSTRLIVIFKKGDPKLPGNYRPIAILPILYKLFSRMLCNRVQQGLLREQSVDQAAYRPGFSTEDHLLCTTLLLERCAEWNIDLWMCLIDFEKAFDAVEHDALWKVLEDQGVHCAYVDLLKSLYEEQTASVMAGCQSRTFALHRGVKQGDPISALLFIAVMEAIFRNLKTNWNRLNAGRKGQYYGIVIDKPEDPLTNLRFADDVLLFSSSKTDIAKMVTELGKEAEKYGLKLHMGKTKVMTNAAGRRPRNISCNGLPVEVLDSSTAERYLGRQLAVDGYHSTELVNRLNCGWRAFFKFKDALCNRNLPLKHRMKLFESVVTPCVLYASGTWTMTADDERQVRTTERRMLRWILRVGRKPDEDWVEYIKRATHRCEELAAGLGVSDWVLKQRARKWTLAGRVASQTDGRWSTRVLSWKPWFRIFPKRDVGRPRKRWEDDIVNLAGESWMTEGIDQDMWSILKDAYVQKIM